MRSWRAGKPTATLTDMRVTCLHHIAHPLSSLRVDKRQLPEPFIYTEVRIVVSSKEHGSLQRFDSNTVQ